MSTYEDVANALRKASIEPELVAEDLAVKRIDVDLGGFEFVEIEATDAPDLPDGWVVRQTAYDRTGGLSAERYLGIAYEPDVVVAVVNMVIDGKKRDAEQEAKWFEDQADEDRFIILEALVDRQRAAWEGSVTAMAEKDRLIKDARTFGITIQEVGWALGLPEAVEHKHPRGNVYHDPVEHAHDGGEYRHRHDALGLGLSDGKPIASGTVRA